MKTYIIVIINVLSVVFTGGLCVGSIKNNIRILTKRIDRMEEHCFTMHREINTRIDRVRNKNM